ncbi:cyclic GMP-AMP synthase DncV-like nucleotidyltransferase [Bernardetia sp. OM2101]|uniref:cyclic GMP-AMP synthase DncV-like nucleotidyltransferase n=1 Tax=Bernardetia sp. OM2101 TaxID=3344876 RepID=UPI0035CFB142
MAVLNQQFTEFNKKIKLTSARKDDLMSSRDSLKKKIKEWFKENKKNELQPKFWGQGSSEMNTTINPIPQYEGEEKKLKYDLDYGIYFIENENEDNIQNIDTWHNWVCEAVKDHTSIPPVRKTTCVRVVFSNGRHIDLPIYYKDGDKIELAHRSKGWTESDPKAFFEWFNNLKNKQLERIVRYLKAWKNYRENCNTNLKLPSGFELTILASNNYVECDNDDEAFRETVSKINEELNKVNGFKCERPTAPIEDIFADYSQTRRENFLDNLNKLVNACEKADEESNRKKASEIMRKEFGDRFPTAPDIDDKQKSDELSKKLISTPFKPKPFAKNG